MNASRTTILILAAGVILGVILIAKALLGALDGIRSQVTEQREAVGISAPAEVSQSGEVFASMVP